MLTYNLITNGSNDRDDDWHQGFTDRTFALNLMVPCMYQMVDYYCKGNMRISTPASATRSLNTSGRFLINFIARGPLDGTQFQEVCGMPRHRVRF